MPTPEYVRFLDDLHKAKGVTHGQTRIPDRDSLGVRASSGVDHRADPLVLSPVMAAFARAHRSWALRHAPWLLKEHDDA
jgi:hypothetical protein